MRTLGRLLHALAHLTGANLGRHVAWRGRDGRMYSAFVCSGCGRVSGAEEMPALFQHPKEG